MNIVFTREMPESEVELALKLGIMPISMPLIGFEFVGWLGILSEHPDFWEELGAAKAVVFTSKNGVRGVVDKGTTSANDHPDFINKRVADDPGKTSNSRNQLNLDVELSKESTDGASDPVSGGTEVDSGDKSFTKISTLDHKHRSNESITQKFLEIIKKKPVYTVGESTADALEPYGILARFPDDYNATTLAKMMLMDGVHTRILHFCGDIRRPELGEAMNEAGIDVKEVIVYNKIVLSDSMPDSSETIQLNDNTISSEIKNVDLNSRVNKKNIIPDNEMSANFYENPHSIIRNTKNTESLDSIDGVVFYSPSAVQAFFGQNLDENFKGTWFAIGQTTASALRELGIEPLVPRAPTSELMIEFIAKYFKSGN